MDTNHETHAIKPKNIIEQYKEYVASLAAERESIKKTMSELSARLKEINVELDKEKTDAKNIVSLMTHSRKRRTDKAPTPVDENGNALPPKPRGRPKKNANAQNVAQ